MGGSTFGKIWQFTSFGESHGVGIGVVIEGCPAGLEIDKTFIETELAKRRPGQSAIVTQRQEPDTCEILSGTMEGVSTGTPIAIWIANQNQQPKDYNHIADKFRPSHADYTYTAKYGIRDYRGGGRSSARETAARVAAGAIAKLLLKHLGVDITAYVSQVGHIIAPNVDHPSKDTIESNVVRCAHTVAAVEMEEYIKQIRKEGDTIGGMIRCVIKGTPAGLGEPVYDRLHADLGKSMLSINAVKGYDYGSGFDAVTMKGSDHNDAYYADNDGKVKTSTNFSGGIQGGISNGLDIYFRVAFKPVATIMQDQQSVDKAGKDVIVTGKGRHDPCVVPRAVPIVEAMAANVLVDHLLRSKTSKLSDVIE
ncbi:chorismate synthase [Saprospiraceae bacterium]|nr:chorismate synthase [Saprospiraceae bacterium]MDA9333148.1 chorismate synthase [Saprospiraceae bacterium]MDB4162714.1 chorismate synthase [Saprospiraceae bacterium]MDB9915110.1 chorismate synthase [Saprospiraceae bacterium]HCV51606.1 chorismate synthase [Saprospirales bacterium]